MLAKWITHATVDLDLSCFMLVLPKEASRESSMCDPFCENPAFLARAILTLIPTLPTFDALSAPKDLSKSLLFIYSITK